MAPSATNVTASLITSKAFSLPETAEEMHGQSYFNLWRSKLWPIADLHEGGTLYFYESRRQSLVWKTRVRRCTAFVYSSKREAAAKLRAFLGDFDQAQPYFVGAPESGHGLAYTVDALERLDLPKPKAFRFPMLGWHRVDSSVPKMWMNAMDEVVPNAPTTSHRGTLSELTSPTAVKLAIQKCDKLGREKFLGEYGFSFARQYVLRYGGKEYDSKAIGCVAHAIQLDRREPLRDVSGGKNAVGKRVFDLGFDVDGLKRRPTDWTLEQCEITADAYFRCLGMKLRGESYNRAAACREVAARIRRSEGAVDYKFQNIDAILFKHGFPRMMNAVASNIQRLLEFVVIDPLAKRTDVFEAVAQQVPPLPTERDVFVPVPQINPRSTSTDEDEKSPGVKIDFAARDARSRELGRSGEEWVVLLERDRFKKAHRDDLAKRVRWVAKEDGDGFGYDITSFDEQGRDIFIEVKTTNGGAKTPFLISPNELAKSDRSGSSYCLYRVFDFGTEPKVFVLKGPLSEKLRLEARVYIAVPMPSATAAVAGGKA